VDVATRALVERRATFERESARYQGRKLNGHTAEIKARLAQLEHAAADAATTHDEAARERDDAAATARQSAGELQSMLPPDETTRAIDYRALAASSVFGAAGACLFLLFDALRHRARPRSIAFASLPLWSAVVAAAAWTVWRHSAGVPDEPWLVLAAAACVGLALGPLVTAFAGRYGRTTRWARTRT
jgi:hypothetical protein